MNKFNIYRLKSATGSADGEVMKLQSTLNDKRYTDSNNKPLRVDGIYGEKTNAAFEKMLKKAPEFSSNFVNGLYNANPKTEPNTVPKKEKVSSVKMPKTFTPHSNVDDYDIQSPEPNTQFPHQQISKMTTKLNDFTTDFGNSISKAYVANYGKPSVLKYNPNQNSPTMQRGTHNPNEKPVKELFSQRENTDGGKSLTHKAKPLDKNGEMVEDKIPGCNEYTYSLDGTFYANNNKNLKNNAYYVTWNGKKYKANSLETIKESLVKGVKPTKVNTTFMDGDFQKIIDKADEKGASFYRIATESYKLNNDGTPKELDFKYQLKADTLYLIDGKLYNRNEAGNFIWSYFLAKHGHGLTSRFMAQAGSIIEHNRLDEPFDSDARKAGRMYYYKNMSYADRLKLPFKTEKIF